MIGNVIEVFKVVQLVVVFFLVIGGSVGFNSLFYFNIIQYVNCYFCIEGLDIVGGIMFYGINIFEEIVFGVDLIFNCFKLFVVIGVMRFDIYIFFDGCFNFFQVVVIVVFFDVRDRGGLIVFNDCIIFIYYFIKFNVNIFDIFRLIEQGNVGVFFGG